jgi:pimeloyl-ACP methyl ester carboxylesterase
MHPRLRRTLITTAIVLIVILLTGATYQGLATALERRKYPHPGHLMDVGGHQLHIHCTGEGSPTVVLEAAASGLSAGWGLIQPEIAGTTRVCSYDRAGLGWSEAGDRPFDPSRVPDELHALLEAADVPPPYVVAGHSLGASFARVFAARYPDEVTGLVLIDPPSGGAPGDSRFFSISPWLARAGVLRATRLFSSEAAGLPQPAAGAVSSFLNRPDHLTRASRELARWDDAVRLAQQAPLPPRIVVAEVRLGENDEVAVLNDREAAGRATAAIVATIGKVRRAAAPRSRAPGPR